MLNLTEAKSWLPPELQQRTMRPYYLPLTTPAAIAALGVLPLSTSFQNVSAFLLTAIHGRVYTAAAPQTTITDPPFAVTVNFSAGDEMTFGAVPFSSVIQSAGDFNAGQAGLVAPRLIPGGSNITVTLTSYDGAIAYLVRLALCGINIYPS
jgi:hypothetical protein